MNFRVRVFVLALAACACVWGGMRLVQYFFDWDKPVVEVRGLTPNGMYAGDVSCALVGKDAYAIESISLLLDDEPLVESYGVHRKRFVYPFVLTTNVLADGEHVLKVVVDDSSYRRNKTEIEIPFFVDNVPLKLVWVSTDKKCTVFQGKTVHIQFQSSKPLQSVYAEFLGARYPCVQERDDAFIYEVFIPIKIDERPSEYPLVVRSIDRVGEAGELTSKVLVVPYPAKQKTCKTHATLAGERGGVELALARDVSTATSSSPSVKRWNGTFDLPCRVREPLTLFGTSCVGSDHGVRRAEFVDFGGYTKGTVWACQSGVVVIKRHYPHIGNTVVIDHGCGIMSLYLHLDSVGTYTEGMIVSKGTVLGTLSSTNPKPAFSWGMRLYNIPVDPVQWTRQSF